MLLHIYETNRLSAMDQSIQIDSCTNGQKLQI